MALIPESVVASIYDKADLTEIVRHWIPELKKEGSGYTARSPWKSERTPSFKVSPSKQVWKCFATDRSGKWPNFLMQFHGWNYRQAMDWAAEYYGIEIPGGEIDPITRTIYRTMNIMQNWQEIFQWNLMQTPQVLAYMTERGFSEEVLLKFGVGYCHGQETQNVSFEESELLMNAGLVKQHGRRCFFGARITFPFRNMLGKVHGWQGRVFLPGDDRAKYIGSKDTQLFHKNAAFFGLYENMEGVRKDGAIMVEGPTDVLAASEIGLHRCFAASGTSISQKQIRKLLAYTDDVTIMSDGDSAGIKSVYRHIGAFYEAGVDPKVCLPPSGHDLDSMRKTWSSHQVVQYISQYTCSSVDFAVQMYKHAPENVRQSHIDAFVLCAKKIEDMGLHKTIMDSYSTKMGLNLPELIRNVGMPKPVLPPTEPLNDPEYQIVVCLEKRRDLREDIKKWIGFSSFDMENEVYNFLKIELMKEEPNTDLFFRKAESTSAWTSVLMSKCSCDTQMIKSTCLNFRKVLINRHIEKLTQKIEAIEKGEGIKGMLEYFVAQKSNLIAIRGNDQGQIIKRIDYVGNLQPA